MMNTARAVVDGTYGDPIGATNVEPIHLSRPQVISGLAQVRVVIANHQPIVRHGLRALLDAEPDITVVGEAEDGEAAVTLARRFRPGVVVVDLLLPGIDGIGVTRIIRGVSPDTQVVVVMGVDEDASAIESIRAGATAYLLRDTRTDVLVRTIRGAGAGQVALPAQAAARLVRVMGRHEALSEREADVLRLVAHGLANKQIARELGIAQSTVKSHVGSILGKLGLMTRTQMALYAARTGLVALERLSTGAMTGQLTTAS
jgi:NarL family two-component system response regulator LiaR